MDMLETRQMLSGSLSIAGTALTEPNTGILAATFPVTLSQASTSDVTVKYKTIPGSAKAGKDFVATHGTLTIPAGSLNADINISVIGGVSGNTTKSFEVKLSKPKNATITAGIAGCTITDDITPSLSVQSATTVEGIGKHAMNLAVLLSGKNAAPVTVNWATANGSATAGTDYTASQGSLTFKPNQILKTISIPIIGDSTPTSDITFNVNLSNPTNATVANNGVETIVGNSGENQVFINDASIVRPAKGYKDLNFKVHLLNPSDGTVSVQYATLPGAGSVGQYVSVSGTLQFLKGQSTTNLTVPIVGTTFYNPKMTFYVQLSDPVDAQLADTQATGTIYSNSSPPAVPPPIASVNSISENEGNSGTTPFTFNVTLSTASKQPVVVYYQTQDGTAISGTDYDGGSGAVYFAPGVTSQPVTVDVIGNTNPEPNKTFDLQLTGATNAYLSQNNSTGQATILNDDVPAISIANTQVPAIPVGTTTTATFTVSLNEQTYQPVTVDYATADGTATTAAGDYDPASGVLTFAPGVTSQTVNVTVNGQGNADIGDYFYLNLTNASAGSILGTAQATATVVQTPTISVNNVTVDESPSGGNPAVFTVSLSNATSLPITVHYVTSDGTATAGTNYTATSGTLTFQPGGATSQNVSVPVGANIEDGETFFLNLSSPSNAVIATGQGIATLSNPPVINVSDPIIPTNGASGGQDIVPFTISLSAPSTHTVMVSYHTADGTATAPEDYHLSVGTLTFTPGTTTQTVNILTFPNSDIPDGSNFYLDLTDPIFASLGVSSAQGIFSNLPVISANNITVPVSGGSGTTQAQFTVNLSSASANTIGVHYTTQDGTAVANTNYTPTSGTLTFTPGTTSQTVNVAVDNNDTDGSQFYLDLSSPTDAIIETTQATATVSASPVISISPASVEEGNSGTTPMTFNVTLSHASTQNISVDYATSDGTEPLNGDDPATQGDDYQTTNGVLNIPAGQTTGTITVNVYGDTTPETDEYFYLTLTDPTHATLGSPSQVTGTILNDDGGGITVSNVYVPENDPNFNPTEAIFTVTLASPYADDVYVHYVTEDGTAVGGVDFTSTSGDLDFAPGQVQKIVTVPITDAFLSNQSNQFSLALTSVSSGVALTQSTGTATIIDNDAPPVVSVTGGEVEESADPNNQPSLPFTITVNGPITSPITINYNTDDNPSGFDPFATVPGVDYVSTSSSVTFPVTSDSTSSQTVYVPIIGGNDSPIYKYVGLQISSSDNVTFSNTEDTGEIDYDNVEPYLSIQQDESEYVSTAANTIEVPVTLNHATTQDVSFTYATEDGSAVGTASGGNDYESSGGGFTIPAGQTTVNIPIHIIDDPDLENNIDFQIQLTGAINAILPNSSSVSTDTIQPDNALPTASINAVPSISEGDSGTTEYDFSIDLSSAYRNPVTVNYHTSDGTALSDGLTPDYQSASGSVTFQPDQTSITVPVYVYGNTIEQPDRTFYFNIDSTDVDVDGSTPFAATIQDDDEPVLNASGGNIINPPAGQTQQIYFTASLAKPLSYPVTMDYSTSGGGDEIQQTSGSITFQPGDTSKQIPVNVSGGSDLEGNDNVVLYLTAHDPLNGDVNAQATGTVYATDETNVSVSAGQLSPLNADTSTFSFTVTNNGADATPTDQLAFYAIPYGPNPDCTRYQIEALDPNTNQVVNTLSSLGPSGAESGNSATYTVDPVMVDANGNPIPAGYYYIKVEVLDSDSNRLASDTTSNEMPYIHTQVIWTGSGGDDQWSDPANWNIDAVPGVGDDVIIPNNQAEVIGYDAGDTEINSLFSNAPIGIDSGSLTIDTTVQVNNDFYLSGGELINATLIPGDSGQGLLLTADGGQLKDVIADAQIDAIYDGAFATVVNQLTLNQTLYLGDPNSNNSATLYFTTDGQGCAYLTGTGGIGFGESGDSQIVNEDSNGSDHMLVIETGINGPGGTISSESGIGTILNDGNIEVGSLTVNGNFVNNAQLYPGGDNDPGTLTINGNFTQTSDGTTNIDIGGPGATDAYDQINVSGAATLDGTLNFGLTYGYQPSTTSQTTFDIITYQSVDGTFATINGSNNYYSFTEDYGATIFSITATYTGPVTYYVDSYFQTHSPQTTPDGLSWQTAFPDLQDALVFAQDGDTIDVAQGTYTLQSQDDSFDIPGGVSVNGGFAGMAVSSDPGSQLSTYVSTLSGDLAGGGNAYHVVYVDSSYTGTSLNNFVIRGGDATDNGFGGGLLSIGSPISITNCTFTDDDASNQGGAIYFFDATPTITNCTFTDDSADDGGAIELAGNSTATITLSTFTDSYAYHYGGAIATDSSNLTLTNCTFEGNSAGIGGAIATFEGQFTATNCAFVTNVAFGYSGGEDERAYGGYGGAIEAGSAVVNLNNVTLTNNYAENVNYNENTYAGYGGAIDAGFSNLTVTNSIIWNDHASYSPEINTSDQTRLTLTNTDIDDSSLASGGTDSFDADPLFNVSPGPMGSNEFGDLHLTWDSPAIDAGNQNLGTTSPDLSGNPRVVGSNVDLGAYEAQFIYVDGNAGGNNDGSSWTNAYTDLQSALNAASAGFIIEVAGNQTYFPDLTNGRDSSFDNLGNESQLVGGFAGSNNPGAHDLTLYPTTLSGNIGSGGLDSDNIYHIFTSNQSYYSRIDGFTFTGGNANGYHDSSGGALAVAGGNVTIANCTFNQNTAAATGGAIYAENDAILDITNCTFNANSSSGNGGAVGIDSDSTVNFTGDTFLQNTAAFLGGAIYSANTTASTTITDCKFESNTAIAGGGAIAAISSFLTVVDSIFIGNLAAGGTPYGSTTGGQGGAIYASGSNVTVDNDTFTQNTAQGQYANGFGYYGSGGAIAVANSSNLTVTNSILWNNSAFGTSEYSADGSSDVLITYSDTDQGGSGAGDIDSDPIFARTPNIDEGDYGDLRLLIGSEAIDAGNNSDVPDGITTDLAGAPRFVDASDTSDTNPADAIVDMGAYETNPIYVDSNALEGGIVMVNPSIPVQGTSWGNPFTDINSALAFAQFEQNEFNDYGQMIFIAGGDYYAGTDSTGTYNLISDVSLFGGFDGVSTVTPNHRDVTDNPAVLNGDLYSGGFDAYSDHIITASSVSSVTLDGLYIENAQGDYGNGLYAQNSSLLLNDCTFADNTSNDDINGGGAIYAEDSNPTIINCLFTGNAANGANAVGGAIALADSDAVLIGSHFNSNTSGEDGGAIGLASSSAAINSCFFDSNTNQVEGGAIAALSSNAVIENSTFTNNGAIDDAGGAIYGYQANLNLTGDLFGTNQANYGGAIYADTGTDLDVDDSTFTGNTAYAGSGGAIYAASGAQLDLTHSTLTGNDSNNGGAVYGDHLTIEADQFNDNSAIIGGAISASGPLALIDNSTFVANTASQQGAAVQFTNVADASIVNSTITANIADNYGGAVNVVGGAAIINSILWGDTGIEIVSSDSSASVSDSDVQYDYNTPSVDPQFVRDPRTNGASDYGDLHLQTTSPLIDQGDNDAVQSSTDLAGNPRISGAAVDMGAYEVQDIYVDAGASGDNDGASWTNAYTTLTQALDNAPEGSIIDIAGGTYFPTTGGDDRAAAFYLISDLTLNGGFNGSNNTALDPNTNDPATYPTILSGNIGSGGLDTDNSFHILYASGGADITLNGLTISDASSGALLVTSDATLSIDNCTFSNNINGGAVDLDGGATAVFMGCTFVDNTGEYGGAIYAAFGTLTLENCTFDANSALNNGGAIDSENDTLTITNCVFIGNVADGYPFEGNTFPAQGGAIYINGVTANIDNSTFTQNQAYTQNYNASTYYGSGGAIASVGSALTVTNSILWSDSAHFGPEISYDVNSTVTVTSTDINDSNLSAGSGDLDQDPLFVSSPDAGTDGVWGTSDDNFGDVSLQSNSPAIDVGNNNDIPAGVSTDIAGNPRINDFTVDLGAYEFQFNLLFVNQASTTGADNGSDWTDAFLTLQQALDAATPNTIIRVAQGTYTPGTQDNPSAPFTLPDGVSLYGSFVGSDGDPLDQNTSLYPTILSGDTGGGGAAYHIMAAYNLTSPFTIDGFTFKDGNSIGWNNYGGALYLYGDTHANIANCTFTDNRAESGGAISVGASSVTILNCTFDNNIAEDRGGAIDNGGGTTLIIQGSTFTRNTAQYGGALFTSYSYAANGNGTFLLSSTFDGNTATYIGGAVDDNYAYLGVTNCVFSGNALTGRDYYGDTYSPNSGAALSISYTQAQINDSTFAQNYAGVDVSNSSYYGKGNAISANSSLVTITNSILWDPSNKPAGEVYSSNDADVLISYTDVSDSILAGSGPDNLSADPNFVRTPSTGPDGVWGTTDDDYGDLRLLISSPAVDAGNNLDVPANVTTDIAGNPRFIDAADTSDTDPADQIVDMGAYETNPVYVDGNLQSSVQINPAISGSNPAFPGQGSSWTYAYTDIQSALANAHSGQMIFVAAGDYFVEGTDPTATINLVNGVSLFGGFNGSTGGNPNGHPLGAYSAIVGQYGSGGQDAYHVITADNVNSPAAFDYFEVVQGNADGPGDDANGAGMFIENSNLAIMNSSFFGLQAASDGGAIYISGGSPLLDNVTMQSDSAPNGNGIYSANASPIIENSLFSGNTAATYGGALYLTGGSPVVEASIFDGNTADQGGGAIYLDSTNATLAYNSFSGDQLTPGDGGDGGAITLADSSTAQVISGSITGSEADNGGAIAVDDSTLNLIGTTFTSNTSAAIYSADGATISIDDADFSDNTTSAAGGAINAVDSTLTITNSDFTGNQANSGGAISVDNSANSSDPVNIDADTFSGNIAVSGGAVAINNSNQTSFDRDTFNDNSASFIAGAVGISGSTATISNSLFTLNSASNAGAISLGSSTFTLVNSTLTGNTGPGVDGIIEAIDSTANVQNSILYADIGTEIYNYAFSNINVSNSDVEGYSGGTNNVDVDPDFRVDADINAGTPGDEHLSANSPLFGLGDTSFVTTPLDLDGNPRIVDGQVDMGAYQRKIIYVDGDISKTDNTGTSWADAYRSLTAGLAAATNGDVVEVAAGTYTPSDTDPTASFVIPSGVELEGGFAGSSEPGNPGDQNPQEFPTILSGDIGSGHPNSYSIVSAINTAAGTSIYGFTVTDGTGRPGGSGGGGAGLYSLGGYLTVSDCDFTNNTVSNGDSGGAIYVYSATAVSIINCTFSDNSAGSGGAVYASQNAPVTMQNCIFTSNTAGSFGGAVYASSLSSLTLLGDTFANNTAQFGGAVYLAGGTFTVINCVFVNNSATGYNDGEFANGGQGGAIYLYNATATITSSTFADNSAQPQNLDGTYDSYGGALSGDFCGVTISNSILWNDYASTAGTSEAFVRNGSSLTITSSDVDDATLAGGSGDIDANPQFVRDPLTNGSTDDGDLHLQLSSPAVDTGNNADIPSGISTDLDGDPRISGLTVDMGAYEYQHEIIYVDQAATGGQNNGDDWADAYTDLQSALAEPVTGEIIEIAGGTYTPGASRTDTFEIPANITILGGFAGSTHGIDPDTRNTSLYTTTLSGNLDGNFGDDSYNVVTFNFANAATVLDGLTITGGNADGQSAPYNTGGALNLGGSSPTIQNCDFPNNFADQGAVADISNGSPVFTNCTFAGSTSSALYFSGGDLTVTDCSFTNNSTSQTGAAFYGEGFGQVTISGSTFSGNSALYGGAVFNTIATGTVIFSGDSFTGNSDTGGAGAAIQNEYADTVSITDCTFKNNFNDSLSGGTGSAVYNYDATVTITGSQFIANTATGTNSSGGAMTNIGGTITVSSTIFAGNTASAEGGAIYDSNSSPTFTNDIFVSNVAGDPDDNILGLGGAVYDNNSNSTFINCTFSTNDALDPVSAYSYGGAIYATSTGAATTTVINTILWNDQADFGPEIYTTSSATAAVSYSDVDGGFAGTSNINADPIFSSNSTAQSTNYGDLHLQAGSPAIDAGNSSYGGTTDFDGNPRDVGASVDMGAYEAQVIEFNSGGSDWTTDSTDGAENPSFNGTVLTLTDNTQNDSYSAFANNGANIASGFSARFTYTATGSGDGFTFMLQPYSPPVVSTIVGDLGVANFEPSVGIEFNISTANSQTPGVALETDGSYNPNFTAPGSINLSSGDPIAVVILYNDSTHTLNLQLTDESTSQTYSTSYSINIPSTLNASTSYVGFTASTSSNASVQTIQNFQFVSE